MPAVAPDGEAEVAVVATDERQPLLEANKPSAAASAQRRTPLPWKAIAVLMAVRLAEPVSSTVIFPFVNELVARDDRLKLSPSQVGYYSGVIESVFALCQSATVLQYGKLSDRIGRKPVLLIGCLGTALSVLSFGFSRHLPAMIISRSLSGVLCGNVGVIKAAFGELTDSTNEALAFAILPLGWSVGASLAPLLGGLLFDKGPTAYPALLPCAVASLMPLGAFVVCWLFFEETLPEDARKRRVEEAGQKDHQPAPGVAQLLQDRNICLVVANYAAVALIGMAVTALIPLAGWTAIEYGGLGLSEQQIGTALSLQSIGLVLCQSVLFAILQARLGTLGLLRATVPFFTIGLMFLPLATMLARQGKRTEELVAFGFTLVCCVIGNLCYGCLMLLVNSSAPSRNTLATMNGLVQTLASFMRAVGPAGVSTLFALSVHKHILSGQLVWVCLFVLGVIAFLLSCCLRPTRGWRELES